MIQDMLAGRLYLLPAVPPSYALQDRRAAGLASQADRFVGTVLGYDLQGLIRYEIGPDLGGKGAEVDGLLLLGQLFQQSSNLLQPRTPAIGAIGEGVWGGGTDVLMAAGIPGDDGDGTVAHAAPEKAGGLAVGAAPGAAAGDLYGGEDPGKRGIEVQVHRGTLFRKTDQTLGLVGDALHHPRITAIGYRPDKLGQGLLALAHHNEVEVLQDLFRQGGGVGASGDVNGVRCRAADLAVYLLRLGGGEAVEHDAISRLTCQAGIYKGHQGGDAVGVLVVPAEPSFGRSQICVTWSLSCLWEGKTGRKGFG